MTSVPVRRILLLVALTGVVGCGSQPSTSATDAGASDGPPADGWSPDASGPDSSVPDGSALDGSLPDGPAPDGSPLDAALHDGSPHDASAHDGGLADGSAGASDGSADGSTDAPVCVTAADGPASGQMLARLGAYYFDGWTGPLTSGHLAPLVTGSYTDRQPLSGWLDSTPCAVEQQLAWAHRFGLSFFVFDWYFGAPGDSGGENLNSALDITAALPNRHGMDFAILYVNSSPFIATPADWSSTIAKWIGYMKAPGYTTVAGKPLLVVYDMKQMRQTFGSSAAVSTALAQLRTAAQSSGLPGVYVAGVFPTTDGAPVEDGLFPNLSIAAADGYDAVTLYGYSFSTPLGLSGALPYPDLAAVGSWISGQAAAKSPLPFIPVVQDGWDARPWNENETGRPEFWFTRAPGDVATAVSGAITAAESAPQVLAEPSTSPPLVLLEAWNELGEGSYITPTTGEGTTVGDALATTLSAAPARGRVALTLTDTGAANPGRAATGTLTDATGAPLAGATVTLTAAPAAGTYAQAKLTGTAPANAVTAVLGFRVNTDDPVVTWPGNWAAGPSSSDLSLYQVSYVETAGGGEHVVNGGFSSGAASWTLSGQAQLVASDRGAGSMVKVLATPSQPATLDSAPFPVTAGAAYQVTFSARIAPSAQNSGYYFLAFRDANDFLQLPGVSPGTPHSESLPFTPGRVALGTTTTTAQGSYTLSLAPLGTSAAVVDATYAGDGTHWPGFARTGP